MIISVEINSMYDRMAFQEMLNEYARYIMPTWREIKDNERVNKQSHSYQTMQSGVRIMRELRDQVCSAEIRDAYPVEPRKGSMEKTDNERN